MSNVAAVKKYQSNMGRITIRPTKELEKRIKWAAKQEGMSVQGWIFKELTPIIKNLEANLLKENENDIIEHENDEKEPD